MFKANSLAHRVLSWFIAHPGLHNAITLEELRVALGVVSHTIGQRISDLRRHGVTIICKLTYSDGVTTDEARLLGIKHDDTPRYRHYLPVDAVAEVRKLLAAAPDQNGKKAEKSDTPTSTAASGVPPPTSEAHSTFTVRVSDDYVRDLLSESRDIGGAS